MLTAASSGTVVKVAYPETLNAWLSLLAAILDDLLRDR